MAVGRPGGAGVTVAVLDTGIAYADRGRFRRSPDFSQARFVRGYDFVDDDPYPNDDNGHGTHVAGTIAEHTGDGVGVTGLAYGARLMPVRVLDRSGEGDTVRIARGIRWAADHGAKIINLSFEFPSDITRQQIPNILDSLRHARNKGVLVVGASGNAAAASVAYPARSHDVLAVGATTRARLPGRLLQRGAGPRSRRPRRRHGRGAGGRPELPSGRPPGLDVFQMTFTSSVRSFGLPDGYIGTSMAAPHASATAALDRSPPACSALTRRPRRSSAGWRRRRAMPARPAATCTTARACSTPLRATDPAIPVT